MAKIRLYQIAQALGIETQEVVDLLRSRHGIDVKSASSTVEEIVARQFTQRVARDRQIHLSGGSLFSQRPVARRGGKRMAPPTEAAPAKPKLGPPRLIKSAKAARAAAEAEARAAEAEAAAAGTEDGAEAGTAAPATLTSAAPPAPIAAPGTAGTAEPAPATAASASAAAGEPGTVEPPAHPGAPATKAAPLVAAPAATTAAAPQLRPRLVKVQRPRLKIETDDRQEADAATVATPAAAPPGLEAPAAGTAPAEAAPPAAVARGTETPGAGPAAPEPPGVEAPPAATPAAPRPTETPAAGTPAASPRVEAPPAAAPAARVAATPAAGTTPAASPRVEAPPAATPAARVAATPAATTAPAGRPRSSLPLRPTGRVVPSKLRLRVEEPRRVATPATPGTSARTAPPPARPATPVQPRLGGPRPLPSPPVRPAAARPLPPRPAVGGYRPPPRPPHRPGGRRAHYRRARVQTPAPTPAPPPPITRTITLAEGMTVKDLAGRLEVKPKDILKKLIERRVMMTINTTLDSETATMIAREFGAEVNMRTFEEEMVVIEAEETKPEDIVVRAPVVTVMGHVDHGKTTLLDAIRETKVAEGEAGGITQHIGAYSASINGRRIVFLDTPGHEAFTLMRARGAQVTDIVVLVVAADDGVMPQTQEAIDHARAADVPILVAINKIDKSDANPDRVKQELSERGLTPEDWGGSTVTVPVSAKKRENLDGLLEMILLVTELEEQKASPKRAATGTVLEAKVDRGRGPVATVLVQDGTLRVGDNFIAGLVVGRVRALLDDRVQQASEAGPSSPVEVLGLTGLPQPGDAFQAVADAAKARQIAVLRQNQAKEKKLGGRGQRLTLESLQQQLVEGSAKELPIIIKADVQGSAEVLADSLGKLGDERVKTRIIHTGVGAISEWDVLLASTSNAIIIGFNVRPDRNATGVAEREGVDLRLHSVIYDVTDELKKALAGMLEPTTKELRLGVAEVRQTFKVPKFGTAAGCMVTEGVIARTGDAQARLVRDGVVVHEGRIGSLRRFKDDVNEVKTGLECGLAFERFADLKIGDVVESFTVEQVAATV